MNKSLSEELDFIDEVLGTSMKGNPMSESLPKLRNPHNSVNSELIEGLIKRSTVESTKMGDKTLVINVTLPNGFEVTGIAACVDADNYDEQIGMTVATEKVQDKLWELEGYLLQQRLYEAETCKEADLAELTEEIARTAHEVNRAYCQAIGEPAYEPWESCPQWQRDSMLNGVKFHINNPGTTPEQSHENWMKVKSADGWVYGETKDPGMKTHPCMLPYDQLPVEQRVKDSLFKAVFDNLYR